MICRAVRRHDDVKELVGDGGVEPVDNADVVMAPLGALLLRIRLHLDVVLHIVFGEDEVHESTPLGVVVR